MSTTRATFFAWLQKQQPKTEDELMNYALALPAPALASFMKAVEKHETTPDIAKSTSSSTADSACSDVFAKVRCLLKKHASSAVYNHSLWCLS